MFDRIVSDPRVLGGKPCVAGTRISVEFIGELIESGATRDQILQAYPGLAADDVDQVIRYLAEVPRTHQP